ncbi:cation:proton antiporter [Micromonospora sp. FIMYZ51]|uniref:cation:proton antiporter n=1 Tax=Micromonospora sp. FIMYZ51 TaxID=3051832 RepID=UPI00311FE1BD
MSHLIVAVLGDVALVILVSWMFGRVARRLGQPTVIGQIIAGIALGPTLLGRLPGDPSAFLFPAEARPFLTVLSQIAVVLFMFVAGYEIDFRTFRAGRTSISIAAAGVVVPMVLALLAVQLGGRLFTAVDPEHAGHGSFAMFLAVAVAITALPVLAAIVRERGIANTTAGTVSVAAAGFMDVTAWVVLAAVLSDAGQSTRWPWPIMLALLAAFTGFLFAVVRPVLRWWLARPAALLANPVPVAVVIALGSAWVTESLGLHAVFGGFLAGLVMPRREGSPIGEVLAPVQQTASLLLPLFFVTTGLSVDIGVLGADGFAVLGVIMVVAILGKMVPAYLVSRLRGLDARQSSLIAVLVNTRGLTELIVLEVGRSAGLIGPELYAVLVVMALVTTFMTGPLLQLVDSRTPTQRQPPPPGRPERTEVLARPAAAVAVGGNEAEER